MREPTKSKPVLREKTAPTSLNMTEELVKLWGSSWLRGEQINNTGYHKPTRNYWSENPFESWFLHLFFWAGTKPAFTIPIKFFWRLTLSFYSTWSSKLLENIIKPFNEKTGCFVLLRGKELHSEMAVNKGRRNLNAPKRLQYRQALASSLKWFTWLLKSFNKRFFLIINEIYFPVWFSMKSSSSNYWKTASRSALPCPEFSSQTRIAPNDSNSRPLTALSLTSTHSPN